MILVLPIYIWGIAELIKKPKVSQNLSYSPETAQKEKLIVAHFKKFSSSPILVLKAAEIYSMHNHTIYSKHTLNGG